MRYTPKQAMEAINGLFLRMPREDIRQLAARKEELSIQQGLCMFTPKGKVRVIEVKMRPWVVSEAQSRFFHRTSMLLRAALAQMMPMYLADPAVRQILPLEPEEHEWLMAANASGLQRPQSVIDRLDTTADFTLPDWREKFRFLEPNSVGIGGVHYIPATCALTAQWIVPTLRRRLPDLKLAHPDDIRTLVLKTCARHAKGIGRKLKRIVLVEDQSVSGGTDEFTSIAEHWRRCGLAALTADPRDIRIHRDEVTAKGKPVDIIYRDSEITEILEMKRQSGARSVAGIREAFIRNRVVSSIAGEFDHKSCWELFTSPAFARRFSLTQQKLFRSHVLWTRLLWERRTTDPRGKTVDLLSFVQRNRATLVIKPNRAYGGEGVVFGRQSTRAVWERELAAAIKKPFTHVVQEAATVQAELFPVVKDDGTVTLEPFYAVTGFAATQDGLAILGRISKETVVNVSRRGGLVAIWKLA